VSIIGTIAGTLFSKPIIETVGRVLEKWIPDTNARKEAEEEITRQILSAEAQYVKSSADVIVAEAKGESWLQRNWRPGLMFLFGFIIANNYIIVPYAQALFSTDIPTLEIPINMWELIKLGVGGYIIGRSGEKIINNYTKKK